jgi:large subunit ribosomal protein L29
MKVDELRVLEEDELGGRLKAARRELYELRFKHAVGQLENSSQISKVRHDIARIMTVLREREFGIVAQAAPEAITLGAVEIEPEESPAEAANADAASAEDTKPKRATAKATKAKAEKKS